MGAVSRLVAVGDPQTSTTRFFGALAAAELLGPDGWLRPDVQLLAMGDYFDYYVADRAEAQQEGVRLLAWLAAHGRDQVTILLGNHDVARVMELASITDARFEAAHQKAQTISRLARADERGPANAAFLREFPELATPGYAARDYNAFTVEQRALVMRLLLERRCELAAAEHALDGTPVLATHAGVTTKQLAQLGMLHERQPRTIARALNTRLERAIVAVEGHWRAGRTTPLTLEPLHIAGAREKEGGGLLYHRPADPARPGANVTWESGAHAARRYDPRDLPPGLVQVAGHTGHLKAYEEMPAWREAGMPAPTKTEHRGGLHTLSVSVRGDVRYRRGVQPAMAGEAVLWMIDPEMHYVPSAEDVALLELGPSRA
jgi:hypothetical protein